MTAQARCSGCSTASVSMRPHLPRYLRPPSADKPTRPRQLWARRFTGMLAAKSEGTFASLAGLHAGEPIYVCTGRRTDIPRDAITISVDGAPSPEPASYALFSRTPARRPSAASS